MTHELYLIRHAIAEGRGAAWPDDDLRPLTREGTSRFKEVVRGLVKFDVELDRIFTSPLTRARQTAGLLSAGLPGHPVVKLMQTLAPGTPLSKVGPALLGVRGRRLAFVGHEPELGRLAALLIGARLPLVFKKGGICRIDLPSRDLGLRGTLAWLATPGLLRLASRA